jgi:hypothetical protein
MKPNFARLNEFARGYITAALWTFDEDAPSGEYESNGRPEALYVSLDDSAGTVAAFRIVRFEGRP